MHIKCRQHMTHPGNTGLSQPGKKQNQGHLAELSLTLVCQQNEADKASFVYPYFVLEGIKKDFIISYNLGRMHRSFSSIIQGQKRKTARFQVSFLVSFQQ